MIPIADGETADKTKQCEILSVLILWIFWPLLHIFLLTFNCLYIVFVIFVSCFDHFCTNKIYYRFDLFIYFLISLAVSVPDPPTNLQAVNVTDTKALLLWRPALAAIDKYAIVYGSGKSKSPCFVSVAIDL